MRVYHPATGGTPDAVLLGIFVGRALVVGVVVGIVALVSRRPWPEWFYLVAALGVSVVIAVLGAVGRQTGAP